RHDVGDLAIRLALSGGQTYFHRSRDQRRWPGADDDPRSAAPRWCIRSPFSDRDALGCGLDRDPELFFDPVGNDLRSARARSDAVTAFTGIRRAVIELKEHRHFTLTPVEEVEIKHHAVGDFVVGSLGRFKKPMLFRSRVIPEFGARHEAGA